MQLGPVPADKIVVTIVVWTLPLAPGWYEQIVEWKIEHCRGGDEHSALGRLVGVVQQLVASLHSRGGG